jgi:hypothetical protein
MREQSGRRLPLPVLGGVLAALSFLLVVAVVAPALRVPAHQEALEVENPHPWLAHVEVAAVDRDGRPDGWVGLGGVDGRSTHTFAEVVDLGDRWAFRFTYGDVQVEQTLERDHLRAAGWRISVPAGFAAQLRADAVPETPHS